MEIPEVKISSLETSCKDIEKPVKAEDNEVGGAITAADDATKEYHKADEHSGEKLITDEPSTEFSNSDSDDKNLIKDVPISESRSNNVETNPDEEISEDDILDAQPESEIDEEELLKDEEETERVLAAQLATCKAETTNGDEKSNDIKTNDDNRAIDGKEGSDLLTEKCVDQQHAKIASIVECLDILSRPFVSEPDEDISEGDLIIDVSSENADFSMVKTIPEIAIVEPTEKETEETLNNSIKKIPSDHTSVEKMDISEEDSEMIGSEQSEETKKIEGVGEDQETQKIPEQIEDSKTIKLQAETLFKSASPSTSEPAKTNEASEASTTPDNIINILKLFSPEKLEAIKTQLVASLSKERTKVAKTENIANAKQQEPGVPMELTEDDNAVGIDQDIKPAFTKIEAKTESDDDDCVILLDSDDEPEPEPMKSEDTPKEEEIDSDQVVSNSKRKATEDKEKKPKKVPKPSRECINTRCTRVCDEFSEAPRLAISFYYAQKLNKPQFICAVCFEAALTSYEKIGVALLNENPIIKVEIPRKQEMVEILDSDSEDEPNDSISAKVEKNFVFDEEFEREVESILDELTSKIDIKKQKNWIREDMEDRAACLEEENRKIDLDLKVLERQSLSIYNGLYGFNKPKIQRRPSIDICDLNGSMSLKKLLITKQAETAGIAVAPQKLPMLTKSATKVHSTVFSKNLQSPTSISTVSTSRPISVDETFYAVVSQGDVKMSWAPCRKMDSWSSGDGTKMYRVEFLEPMHKVAVVRGKDFALNVVNESLGVGARVVAKFPFSRNVGKLLPKGRFMPGVIGEKLSKYNCRRYLVFCDYGQVQYVQPSDVREISEASPKVWEDVHQNLRTFIYDYLKGQTLRQRPLLNVRLHQRVPTERNGTWRSATVDAIDSSIVRMYFSEDDAYEWLYRGSKRLGPLYSQGQRQLNSNARRNDPNIAYFQIDDDDQPVVAIPAKEDEVASGDGKKNTAKKSTGGAPVPAAPVRQQSVPSSTTPVPSDAAASGSKVTILNDNYVYLDEPAKVMKERSFTPRKDIFAKKFIKHDCGPECLPKTLSTLSNHTPLSKPLLTCWERQIIRQKNTRLIQYKAPCGRTLRDMYEVRRYLILTDCSLNVDNFDFDINIEVLHSYGVLDPKLCPLYIPDMSSGKEGMKIPVINAFDNTPPPALEYSPVRIPMKGVKINTDPEFLACCDCTDDCADKNKCACFQMTIQGFQYAHSGEGYRTEDISYNWKRLGGPVLTGIYECNVRCHCSSRCLNKVVQQPIQIKMQLNRTKNRGWGLQSCHDIPKGTFICIYAGYLYREDDANALCQGLDHGDEYFAALDLLETATPLKEGYESGVIFDSESEDEKDSDSDYDAKKDADEDFNSRPKSTGDREILTRSTRSERINTKQPTAPMRNSDSSDSDGEMVNMEPTLGDPNEAPNQKKPFSLRKYHGKDEKVYVMDAKHCGNVGRYFNHSCDPNMLVQSVFVDTQDMRFPWIAFFSSRLIKAGEELTWNYNYEVGSVPSKVLYCHCGSKTCRGRIL